MVTEGEDTNLVSDYSGTDRAGVATIADVLQAEVQKSQAQLALETAEGDVNLARGTLAVAMGLPANARSGRARAGERLDGSAGRSRAPVSTRLSIARSPCRGLISPRFRVDIQGAQAEVRVAKSLQKRPQLVLGTNLGKTFSNVNNFVGLNYAGILARRSDSDLQRDAQLQREATAEEQVLVASARADRSCAYKSVSRCIRRTMHSRRQRSA